MENEFTFCQKCGEKNELANNFCKKCSAPLKVIIPPPVVQPQYIQPNYVPPYQQQTLPKKKGKGCLIAILIVLGLFIVLGVINAINGGGDAGNTTTTNTSEVTTTQSTTVQSAKDQVTTVQSTTAQPTSAKPKTTVAFGETTSQKNAVRKAKDYLDLTSFSRKGLIEQLEYDGFTHNDAVYATDRCGANWNEQAAKKAKDYLDLTSFSRKGLIEQLEYDGFTQAQAVYGVNANGF